jgi:hypothetical protein
VIGWYTADINDDSEDDEGDDCNDFDD